MPKASLELRAAAFEHAQPIPTRFTEDGEDLSPALTWSGVPATASELALIMDDPDAPSAQPWVHWVIYRIPGATTALPEGIARREQPDTPPGAMQGNNSWGTIGYRGPAPPRGPVHHYHFRLYALDAPLTLKPGTDKAALLKAMSGHILAQGELIGTYQRR